MQDEDSIMRRVIAGDFPSEIIGVDSEEIGEGEHDFTYPSGLGLSPTTQNQNQPAGNTNENPVASRYRYHQNYDGDSDEGDDRPASPKKLEQVAPQTPKPVDRRVAQIKEQEAGATSPSSLFSPDDFSMGGTPSRQIDRSIDYSLYAAPPANVGTPRATAEERIIEAFNTIIKNAQSLPQGKLTLKDLNAEASRQQAIELQRAHGRVQQISKELASARAAAEKELTEIRNKLSKSQKSEAELRHANTMLQVENFNLNKKVAALEIGIAHGAKKPLTLPTLPNTTAEALTPSPPQHSGSPVASPQETGGPQAPYPSTEVKSNKIAAGARASTEVQSTSSKRKRDSESPAENFESRTEAKRSRRSVPVGSSSSAPSVTADKACQTDLPTLDEWSKGNMAKPAQANMFDGSAVAVKDTSSAPTGQHQATPAKKSSGKSSQAGASSPGAHQPTVASGIRKSTRLRNPTKHYGH